MTKDALTSLAMAWQIEAPFWGRLLAALPREMNGEMECIALQAAASGHLQLAVPLHWQTPHRVGLIKHELMHLLLGHPFCTGDFPNSTLFHIAADLEANQFIPAQELPPDAITTDQFPDFRLPPKARLETYYVLLQGFWRQYLERKTDTPSAHALAALMEYGDPALRRHRYWPEIQAGTVVFNWWKSWQEEAIHHSAEFGMASVPGLWEAIRKTKHSGEEDWSRILRRFASTSGHTRLKHTLHRTSARYGTAPGLRILRRQRLLVAVDTSGSIAPEELDRFYREIDHLWRMRIEMTIVECDDYIRGRYRYTGTPPQQVQGRGGTHFDPVLEAADSEHFDGLIFFTDGQAAAPQIRCRTPILWMITPNGIAPGEGIWDRLPGKVMKMMC